MDLRLLVEAETLEDQNLALLGRHGLALSEKHPNNNNSSKYYCLFPHILPIDLHSDIIPLSNLPPLSLITNIAITSTSNALPLSVRWMSRNTTHPAQHLQQHRRCLPHPNHCPHGSRAGARPSIHGEER